MYVVLPAPRAGDEYEIPGGQGSFHLTEPSAGWSAWTMPFQVPAM